MVVPLSTTSLHGLHRSLTAGWGMASELADEIFIFVEMIPGHHQNVCTLSVCCETCLETLCRRLNRVTCIAAATGTLAWECNMTMCVLHIPSTASSEAIPQPAVGLR
jgi:hypothetical protein